MTRLSSSLTALTLATCYLALLSKRTVTEASESESVTWGATDPAWSPDGSELAFSLFGSIWQVPAAGGEAEQVSASEGYHAHPAWSPKGDQIAFVRGMPPGNSSRPSIPGELMLVDTASGMERR